MRPLLKKKQKNPVRSNGFFLFYAVSMLHSLFVLSVCVGLSSRWILCGVFLQRQAFTVVKVGHKREVQRHMAPRGTVTAIVPHSRKGLHPVKQYRQFEYWIDQSVAYVLQHPEVGGLPHVKTDWMRSTQTSDQTVASINATNKSSVGAEVRLKGWAWAQVKVPIL